nr:hypothetical protein [Entomoneis sp.]
MNDQQNFFKLLKYSNELKRNNKYLDKEDPEAFDTLLKFLVRIEDNLHYSEKQEYIELAKDFLVDQITADDFSYSFMAIYEGIGEKLGQMKIKESLELANFLKSSRPELGKLLARIYGSCDSYSPDPEVEIAMSDEKELKDYAQILLFKLQEE